MAIIMKNTIASVGKDVEKLGYSYAYGDEKYRMIHISMLAITSKK